MVRTARGYGTRYRGSRGPNPLLITAVAVLVLAAAAVWFLFGRQEPPQAQVEPEPVQPPDISPSATPEESPAPSLPPTPDAVRGIYISGPVAGDPYMETLLALIDESELNAAVIDVKNDAGHVTYRPETGTAVELDACIRYIRDLPGLVAELKAHGIYTIARIAAFKDPVLAQARPELSLRYSDGSSVSESGGEAWVNPYEPEVWTYLEEIALGAAEAGFDEVQFDYVRFPTAKSMDRVDYGPSAEGSSKTEAVAGFLEQITGTLHDQGVRVSADVFGTVITSQTDSDLIGQDYARLAEIVDCICPMVYPSHYAAGSFGIDIPDQEPYATVYAALLRSNAALSGRTEPAAVRAWLQDFTATWVSGHREYGAEELRAQIQAVYDAGYTDWLLWNARNQYTADGLLDAE